VLIQNLHEANYLLDSQDQAGHPGLLVIKGIVSVSRDGMDIYKHAFKVLPAFIYCILALNLIFILIKVYEIKVILALLFITVNIDRKGIDAKKKMISK
jgi:hypothetical protein